MIGAQARVYRYPPRNHEDGRWWMDRWQRRALVAAGLTGLVAGMAFFGGFLGSYQEHSRSTFLLGVIIGLGVGIVVLTTIATHIILQIGSRSRHNPTRIYQPPIPGQRSRSRPYSPRPISKW